MKNEPLTVVQLGLEEVVLCAPATNGSSASTRYTQLPTLQSAIKIIRDTLMVVVGKSDGLSLMPEIWWRSHPRPLSMKPLALVSALMLDASFGAAEVTNKTTSTAPAPDKPSAPVPAPAPH